MCGVKADAGDRGGVHAGPAAIVPPVVAFAPSSDDAFGHDGLILAATAVSPESGTRGRLSVLSRYRMVVEVALHHRLEPFSGLRNRVMHATT